MENKIRIGVIGTGSISGVHLNAYKNNPNVEIYALCDINEERVKAAAEKYGVTRIFTDMHEMLKLEEIDAVSVCTWNSQHAPCTIAALDAGKHVICEKPMATSAVEARAMKAAADRNGKLLMIGFVRRFGNDCEILQDFISKDYFGELYYTKATYLRRKGNPGGWFGDKSRSGGGPLIDLGVHVIDLVRYLLGNPKPVSVYGATFQKLFDRRNVKDTVGYSSASRTANDICDVEDLASAMIRFDNGAVLSIEASFSLNLKKDEGKIELFGTKAGAKLDPSLEIYSEINDYMANVQLTTKTDLDFNGLFEKEINHFVSCVKDGIECKAPAQDGIELMVILDAIYESARTGHEVIIEN
jgi:predicted dehydrogenase